MFYTVYKTTNKLNGKIYVGIHKTNVLDDDYLGSGKLIGQAIEKYGIENFEKEILAIFDKSSDMFEMESEIVNEEFVNRDDTYNLKLGGRGGWDHLNDGSLEQSERAKHANIIRAQKIKSGESSFSNSIIEKWKDPNYRKRVIDSRKKTMAKFYANGGKGAFTSKKHTDEFKRKTSERMSESQSGSGNSQYGKMWIYNLELKESKRIMKDDPIPEGWLKGRKLKF